MVIYFGSSRAPCIGNSNFFSGPYLASLNLYYHYKHTSRCPWLMSFRCHTRVGNGHHSADHQRQSAYGGSQQCADCCWHGTLCDLFCCRRTCGRRRHHHDIGRVRNGFNHFGHRQPGCRVTPIVTCCCSVNKLESAHRSDTANRRCQDSGIRSASSTPQTHINHPSNNSPFSLHTHTQSFSLIHLSHIQHASHTHHRTPFQAYLHQNCHATEPHPTVRCLQRLPEFTTWPMSAWPCWPTHSNHPLCLSVGTHWFKRAARTWPRPF